MITKFLVGVGIWAITVLATLVVSGYVEWSIRPKTLRGGGRALLGHAPLVWVKLVFSMTVIGFAVGLFFHHPLLIGVTTTGTTALYFISLVFTPEPALARIPTGGRFESDRFAFPGQMEPSSSVCPRRRRSQRLGDTRRWR